MESVIYEEGRLATFTHWPFDSSVTCNKEKMAEAGFFACGGASEPDLAKCFLCGKEMDGWEETDDPWREHRDHAPDCAFVRLDKPQRDMTLGDFLALCRQFVLNCRNRHHQRLIKDFQADMRSFRTRVAKL